MKLVASLQGTVSVEVKVDDYLPVGGIIQRTLIEYIQQSYNFMVGPSQYGLPPIANNPVLPFQAGELRTEEKIIPISQVILYPDGESVVAADTDAADEVLTDLLSRLDRDLGYRYQSANPKRLYASAIVVELDPKFAARADVFKDVAHLLNQRISGHGAYQLKRLAFGTDAKKRAPTLEEQTLTVAQIVQSDVTIERRAGEPLERNRYYCTAPLSTKDLVSLIEEIERIVIR